MVTSALFPPFPYALPFLQGGMAPIPLQVFSTGSPNYNPFSSESREPSMSRTLPLSLYPSHLDMPVTQPPTTRAQPAINLTAAETPLVLTQAAAAVAAAAAEGTTQAEPPLRQRRRRRCRRELRLLLLLLRCRQPKRGLSLSLTLNLNLTLRCLWLGAMHLRQPIPLILMRKPMIPILNLTLPTIPTTDNTIPLHRPSHHHLRRPAPGLLFPRLDSPRQNFERRGFLLLLLGLVQLEREIVHDFVGSLREHAGLLVGREEIVCCDVVVPYPDAGGSPEVVVGYCLFHCGGS